MRRLLLATALLTIAAPAHADQFQTFDLTYSGAGFGNTGTATATIMLDLSVISNPGETHQNPTGFVTAFSITIAGATSGNGTFGFADFNGSQFSGLGGFLLNTNGGTLDFSQQLIGQPTGGEPFGETGGGGSLGAAGDFNIFSNGTDSSAPLGTDPFTIGTSGGSGDFLLLTSFAPAAVPEPSSMVLAALGLAGLAGRLVWRRIRLQTA